MNPIKITAHLAGPVVMHPNEGLTIDGPLLWAVTLEERGDALFGNQPDPATIARESAAPHPRMPLGVHQQGGIWAYKASLGELIGRVSTENHHVHKRFDMALAQARINDLSDRRTRIQTNTGEFKAYRMPRWAELAEAVQWHAVGDATEVLRLLRTHVTHIGKQTNTGLGVVAAWEVDITADENRWMWREDGTPARALPVAWVGGRGSIASIRPPYWIPAHRTECLTPR